MLIGLRDMNKIVNNHIINTNTLVCSCGRTSENHIRVELTSKKIQGKWVDGDVNLERDFAELDKVLIRNNG